MDNSIEPPKASARREEPPLIRRDDYKPYAWLVPETDLDFDLGLERTRVRSRLKLRPNPKARASSEIRLNGDGLKPLGVRLDGEAINSWSMDGGDLVIELGEKGGEHEIAIETEIDPSANTQLMGLYASNGMLCTQCEAEGFRRITFFPDRPDVLSTYRVRMRARKDSFPVLLSNGNLVAEGEGEDGAHWAEWHDPWPKPSYLFALVAGDLVANSAHFVTMSGRKVALNVWVRREDLARTDHALESLKRAMKWDEEVFGREYDLDLFNIVAVSDFNMGAMENKGLNIFNTKYVLADRDTATDADYDAIEGVIAHEYFHNWSGNRVTCRDWFQLSLKEGFTVLRDQLFSQDMRGEAVKRIEDVRVLRAAQFPEDSGPLAHPIRPDSYREISNFYTATVYNKGAEVIRMMRTLAGEEAFRRGTDLYFARHDGEAATCEDFVRAIEEGAGLDLSQFRLWYSQAGTPHVSVEMDHAGDQVTLRLRQRIPATPGQSEKKPMVIPLKLALLDRQSGAHRGEELIVLDREDQEFVFEGFCEPAVLSINRGFTAPVVIEREASLEDLRLLAAHDDDPFARFEAMQELASGFLLKAAQGHLDEAARREGEAAIVEAMRQVARDEALDDSMRAELMGLPALTVLMERVERADPGRLYEEREALKTALARGLGEDLRALYDRAAGVAGDGARARGARKLKSAALALIAADHSDLAARIAARQYERADNMTDRQSALAVLCGLETGLREEKLDDFYRRHRDNPLVIDKWFTLQAISLHPDVLDHVRALAKHPDFTLRNPNRVRALYMALASNAPAFHDPSGEGYRMIADLILKLDPINPQTAARFVAPLGRWRRIEERRAQLMHEQLQRIFDQPGLSRDTFEQVSRSLDG